MNGFLLVVDVLLFLGMAYSVCAAILISAVYSDEDEWDSTPVWIYLGIALAYGLTYFFVQSLFGST